MSNKIPAFATLFITGLWACCLNAQQTETDRFQNIKNNLDLLAVTLDALNEPLKLQLDSNQTEVSVANVLLAISNMYELNITTDSTLENRMIRSQFSNATVAEVLLFLCKEESLTIEFTGKIMAFKPYVSPPEEKIIPPPLIEYSDQNGRISLDLAENPLHQVFREITLKTGINMLFTPAIESAPLKLLLQNVPTDEAFVQMARLHGLNVTKTPEGFYLFDRNESPEQNSYSAGLNSLANGFQVIDTLQRTMKIKANNTPLEPLILDMARALKLNFFIASPLENIGTITMEAETITFDDFLFHVFSKHPSDMQTDTGLQTQNTITELPSYPLSFRVNKGLYFLGTEDLLSVHAMEFVPLHHRSIEILGDPYRFSTNPNIVQGQQNFTNFQPYGSGLNTNNYHNANLNNTGFSPRSEPIQKDTLSLAALIPEDIKKQLDIKVDTELNAFFVSGKHTAVVRFKDFIQSIDKPVPVILIEVMFIEIIKTSEIAAGMRWGIGEKSETTKGTLFPNLDLTLGAKNINRIIGGMSGFGAANIGKVVPEFYAKLKAMEKNGDIRILSTPKMATLNGHRAQFSNNETSYYVVTSQNIYGAQIPQSSEIKNYFPIRAGLTLSVKPFIAGDNQVTLDLFVTQSKFNERITPDAPPGIEAREFSSIIRMRNKDIAVLGGLEQNERNNSGSGIPFLAKIPLIKWLFSERVRKGNNRKLTVLIKPTRID